jgi:hypothetical protein
VRNAQKLLLAVVLFATPVFAQIGITFGTPEPVCSYGYYDYAPYSCAPYGYYGPEFFVGGRYHPRQAWGQNDDHRGHDRDSGNRQKPDAGRQSNGGHQGSGRPGGHEGRR